MSVDIFRNLGGGDEPKKKKPQSTGVYTTQEQVDRDRAFLRSLFQRQGASQWDIENSHTGRVGDKMPMWEYLGNARPEPRLQYLPKGKTLKDLIQTKNGYAVFDDVSGGLKYVDEQAIFQRYK